jgi:nucleoside-diphosphate-sugar epimerase
MAARKHTILVAGASGLVGRAAVEHFARQPDFQVLAMSRRPVPLPDGAVHVALDLCDRAACESAAHNLSGVTHVLYAALFELPDLVAGWRDTHQMQVNEAMLRNLLDALSTTAKRLRHITILQGTKAYGGHVEPLRIPAKERWPRHPHENFYWLQEDMLRARQPHSAWTFSILRPQLVFGHSPGSPMNIVAAIGVYAAIQRELGRSLGFPGGGRYITAASDGRLIAQAAHFAATHEAAANETYNVVNGDMLVWQDLWGSIAQRFGMECGAEVPASMEATMPAHDELWRGLVARHGLQPLSMQQLIGSAWQFMDRVLGGDAHQPPHSVLSPIKLRQHGFQGCMDTEDSLHFWLERMQRDKFLPR